MKGHRAWVTWAILSLLLLVALCLRFYRLDGQSLWADEGNSAALATRNLAAITHDAARDIHPPLYYYLLHFWVRIFGDREIGLRSFSALTGTVLVLVTYLLGRELFSQRTALIAAFLSAISPFQIHYSQETRMYVLAALLSALAVLFFLRWVKASAAEPGWATYHSQPASPSSMVLSGAFYVLFTAAALYTHYFTFTIPLVANVGYGLSMIAYHPLRRPKVLGAWAMAQLLVVGLYYPWLRLAGGQLATWPAVSQPFSLSFLVQDILRVFSLGLSVKAETTPIVVIFGVLLLLGVLPGRLSCEGRGSKRWWLFLGRHELSCLIFAAVFLCLPICAVYVLSLSRPAYDPKFLLLATPPFCLILARGVDAEWLARSGQEDVADGEGRLGGVRVQGLAAWAVTVLALLFVTAARAGPVANYYFDEEYARDDYRGLARYITGIGREGDAVILDAPGQIEIFSYYYDGGLPVYPLPGQRPLDEGKTEEALESIVGRHRQLFVLFWGTDESDPNRFIESWLDRRTFKAMDSWFGNVRLAIYAVPLGEISAQIRHPLELTVGEDILLLGYSISSSKVEAGDILQLTLFWQALGDVEERYKVFIHILDGRSQIVGQRDAEPVGGTRPTTTWEEGEAIADNYGVLVLPGTPPGEHQLEIGMYSLGTGQRLPVSKDGEPLGDHILLEPVQVLKAEVPPLVEALQMQQKVEREYGPLRLLGYDVYKLGYGHEPDEPLLPGDIVHVNLYWQAAEPIGSGFILDLQLLDEGGTVVSSREVRPVGGAYPPASWESGEIVRDQHNLLLPAELPPGTFDLLLQLCGLGMESAPLLLKSLPMGE